MNTSSEKIRAFLGIETAILGGSISLSVNGRAFTPSFSVSRSETILASIQRSLVDANIELSQVDCIAVSIGPGSFTGIRTGIATAFPKAGADNRAVRRRAVGPHPSGD